MIPDPKQFWTLLGQRVVGSTVITVDGASGPSGFLGLSAAHVCANPPTMLVSIDEKTSACGDILAMGRFAVNYLPAGGQRVADSVLREIGNFRRGALRRRPMDIACDRMPDLCARGRSSGLRG